MHLEYIYLAYFIIDRLCLLFIPSYSKYSPIAFVMSHSVFSPFQKGGGDPNFENFKSQSHYGPLFMAHKRRLSGSKFFFGRIRGCVEQNKQVRYN